MKILAKRVGPQASFSAPLLARSMASKPLLSLMKISDHFEGGDVVPLPKPPIENPKLRLGKVFNNVSDVKEHGIGSHALFAVGYGDRNDSSVLKELADKLNIDIVAVPLSLKEYFHADTCVAAQPHGLTIYHKALLPETTRLFEHLYPKKLMYISDVQAEAYGANGRLLRRRENIHQAFDYFHTDTAFDGTFFKDLARLYQADLYVEKFSHLPGGDFTIHHLHYQKDDQKIVLRYIPMPVSEVLKGGGAMSCITLATTTGLWMTPPVHYDLSFGLNPWENSNIGKLNKEKAMQDYKIQVKRLRMFGHTVNEITPQSKLTEQVFTRDPGHFFLRGTDGHVRDVAAFGSNDAFKYGQPVFVHGKMKHDVRKGETRAMIEALKTKYQIVKA